MTSRPPVESSRHMVCSAQDDQHICRDNGKKTRVGIPTLSQTTGSTAVVENYHLRRPLVTGSNRSESHSDALKTILSTQNKYYVIPTGESTTPAIVCQKFIVINNTTNPSLSIKKSLHIDERYIYKRLVEDHLGAYSDDTDPQDHLV